MDNKWAIIDNETKWIINIIIWDGVSHWVAPENTTVKLFSELSQEEIIFPPNETE
jgi:hypothetical protein